MKFKDVINENINSLQDDIKNLVNGKESLFLTKYYKWRKQTKVDHLKEKYKNKDLAIRLLDKFMRDNNTTKISFLNTKEEIIWHEEIVNKLIRSIIRNERKIK